MILIEFNIIKVKIIRKYINKDNKVNKIIKNKINLLFNFKIIINFGKNPINGGNPPKDNKFIKINNLINLFLKFKLNIWFKNFKLNKINDLIINHIIIK